MTNIEIRRAEKSEIEWVNRKYEEVDFLPSNFDNEVIAIATQNGQRVGLGRLRTVDENNLELSGMYVFENFRGQGIARRIIEFLLKVALPNSDIYCIAFQHLILFYKEFGFAYCIELENVPKEILKKYMWCKERYPIPPALLVSVKKI